MKAEPVLFILLALAGLVIGSFLNVCIYRLPRGQSIVGPRSRCGKCGRPIAWYDNIPLVSYVTLAGRCRSCRQSISIVYPMVEAVTAVLFLVYYWRFGPSAVLPVRLAFGAAMVALFVIDLQHQILPNVITLPGILIGLGCSLFLPPGLMASIIGILVGGGVLLAVAELYRWIRGEEGLGMGDVKMLAMVGAFLGWRAALVTLFLSSLVGSLFGVAIVALGKGDMRFRLPYGTFLAVAAVVASLVGDDLVRWYLSLY